MEPTISVQVTGGGSGVGIAGLIDGTLDIAAASREMKPLELQRVRERYKDGPREFTVALDALAVYIHRKNPLGSITLEALAGIYGEGGGIVTWSQMGVRSPACPSDRIIRVSRQNNSRTFAYFREIVLGRTQEYKLGSIDQSGSKDVVALVSGTPCAIGYSGLAFATARVKALPLAVRRGSPVIAPGEQAIVDRSYPLARRLYLYTATEPAGTIGQFLDWVRGVNGQRIVRELRFVPAAGADRPPAQVPPPGHGRPREPVRSRMQIPPRMQIRPRLQIRQ
jgi:phosphate transport system substrate-binding protein